MASYLIRRLGLALLVVWGAVTIMFVMFFVIPGNTLDILSGQKIVQPEIRRNIEKEWGLQKSVTGQYFHYWNRVLHGDLGKSYSNNRSVNELFKQRAANSARLAFWALAIEIVFGIGIGVIAAVRKYSLLDVVTGFVAVALAGIPVFVLGLLLQYGLGVRPAQWNWPRWTRFPVQGMGPNRWFVVIPLGHQWKYLILPAIVLACVQTGFLTRISRTSMLEVLNADYVRTARAKGLRSSTVIVKHALRNALLPTLTVIGLDVIGLFGVAVLTETVFNWPGLGSTIRDYAFAQDVPVVLGLASIVVLFGAMASLLVDVGYSILDPRVRLTTEKVD